MRLFVAVWPDAEILDELATLPRPSLDGVRWTTRDQWHVTLRFLGEVEDAAPVERGLTRAVTDVTAVHAQFEERVRRVGNMLWAPVKGLDAVADAVVSSTGSIGAVPEARRFRGTSLWRERGHGGEARYCGRVRRSRWRGRGRWRRWIWSAATWDRRAPATRQSPGSTWRFRRPARRRRDRSLRTASGSP